MLELVDRQAALTEIDDTIANSLQRSEDVYIDKGLMMARTLIEKLPTIEAEPVRHGQWIAQEDADSDISFVCSECMRRLRWTEDFCPSCGT